MPRSVTLQEGEAGLAEGGLGHGDAQEPPKKMGETGKKKRGPRRAPPTAPPLRGPEGRGPGAAAAVTPRPSPPQRPRAAPRLFLPVATRSDVTAAPPASPSHWWAALALSM